MVAMVIFLQECFDVLLLLLRECDHFERSCLVDIFDILHSQQRLLSKEFFILLNVFVICFRFLNLFASTLDQNISSRVHSKMTSESSLTKGSHSNLIFIDDALIMRCHHPTRWTRPLLRLVVHVTADGKAVNDTADRTRIGHWICRRKVAAATRIRIGHWICRRKVAATRIRIGHWICRRKVAAATRIRKIRTRNVPTVTSLIIPYSDRTKPS
jgi:hypothetical protein